MAKKLKTLSEAEASRRRAVTGLHNLGRDDDADRYDSMSARDYAEEKGIEVVENPQRRRANMAQRKTVAELQDELEDANDQISELQDRLDSIAGIVSGDEDDDQDIVDSDDDDTDDEDSDDDNGLD